MAEFNPIESALEGFRLAREHPQSMGVWAGISLVLSVATYWLMISAAGPQIVAMMDMATQMQAHPGEPADPQQTMDMINKLGTAILPIYPALIGISMVINAIISAANMRMVLRPDERSPGYLRLGGDEARIFAVMLIKVLIFAGLTVVGSLLMGILVGLLKLPGVLLAVLIFLGLIAAGVILAVRLSLATPQTFAERRIMIFQSWGLTQGRMAPLLGCYLLTVVLILVVAVVGSLATGAITAIVGLMLGGAPKVDFSSVKAFFTPLQVFDLIIGSVIAALTLAIKGSPPAVIYRQLTRDSAAAFV